MLRNVDDMVGFAIEATDGELGHVRDLYFDDVSWVIRYLVVETGSWLSNRKVLISPISVGNADWTSDRLPVRLTREQVRASPGIDTDMPVSRRHELEFTRYYGYPGYWGGSGLWGAGYYPGAMLTGVGYGGTGSEYLAQQVEQERMARDFDQRTGGDPDLRSFKAVKGYHVHAQDGDGGHLEGCAVDDETWAIRYLIVNTSNWWLGHEVLVPPEWVTEVSWRGRTIGVDLARQAIKESPHWDPSVLPDRPQEVLVYHHYGRKGYWEYESLGSLAPRIHSGQPRTPR